MTGCDHCNHPLYAGLKCGNCGRVTEPWDIESLPAVKLIYEKGIDQGRKEERARIVALVEQGLDELKKEWKS